MPELRDLRQANLPDGIRPLFVEVGADPSAGSGFQAPQGSIAKYGSTYYIKNTTAATGWITFPLNTGAGTLTGTLTTPQIPYATSATALADSPLAYSQTSSIKKLIIETGTTRFLETQASGTLLGSNPTKAILLGDNTEDDQGNAFVVAATAADTITGMYTAGWQAGSQVTVVLDASVTIKHNGTVTGGKSAFWLNGLADLALPAGTALTFRLMNSLTMLPSSQYWVQEGGPSAAGTTTAWSSLTDATANLALNQGTYTTTFNHATALTTERQLLWAAAITSSAAPGVGFGGEHTYNLASSTGVARAAIAERYVWSTATNGAEVASFRLGLMVAGAAVPAAGSEQHQWGANYACTGTISAQVGAAAPAFKFGSTTSGFYGDTSYVGCLTNGNYIWQCGTGSMSMQNGVYFDLSAGGTAAAPMLRFVIDTDTGIYRIGANSMGLTAGGVLIQSCEQLATSLIQRSSVIMGTAGTIAAASTVTWEGFTITAGTLTLTGSTAVTSILSGARFNAMTVTDASAVTVTDLVGYYFSAPVKAGSVTATNIYGAMFDSTLITTVPVCLKTTDTSGSSVSESLRILHRSSGEDANASPLTGFGAKIVFQCFAAGLGGSEPGVYEYGNITYDNSNAATPGFLSGRFRLFISEGAPASATPTEILNGNRQQITAFKSVFPGTDDTYDLGAAGTRWKTAYMETCDVEGATSGGVVFTLPADATANASLASGRIKCTIGGVTKYLRYFDD